MAAPAQAQAEIDARNAAFWDELCGSVLAEQLGITEASPENLRRFDQAYMDYYPYLPGYLPEPEGTAATCSRSASGTGPSARSSPSGASATTGWTWPRGRSR